MDYILYGTSACHLCELADAIIQSALNTHPFNLLKVDITEDESLVSKYGTKIPLIYCVRTQKSLEWPFDKRQLIHYLNTQ